MYELEKPAEKIAPYIENYWCHCSEPGKPSDLLINAFVDAKTDLVLNFGCSYQRKQVFSSKTSVYDEIVDSNIDLQKNHPIQIIQKGMMKICGIRFSAGGLGAFSKISLGEYNNQVLAISKVLEGNWHNIKERILKSDLQIREIKDCFDCTFLSLLNVDKPFEIFWSLKLEIEKSKGNKPMIELFDENGISAKQAERLFKKYLGFSPKYYAKIVRFQVIIKSLMKDEKQNIANLAADYGYYDQSHLIKDFKALAGGVPVKYRGYFPDEHPEDFAPNVVEYLQDKA